MDDKLQFNNINSSSLCHFTKELDTLKKILRNGIRFSYAFERMYPRVTANMMYPYAPDVVEGIYKDAGVAIPMISFCDIPITRASMHMGEYGHYMIGFDKKHFIDWYDVIINPVVYVHSRNLEEAIVELSNIYAETVKQQNSRIFSSLKDESNIGLKSEDVQNIAYTYGLRKFFIRFILGLIKPIYKPDGDYCFYNEREWRAFLPDKSNDNNDWKWEVTENDYKENRKDWNDVLSENTNNYITIYEDKLPEMLTSIVVNKESEVNEIIEFILDSDQLFGYTNVSKEMKLYLISKITSFERIALDY